jgi:hypothetical protein
VFIEREGTLAGDFGQQFDCFAAPLEQSGELVGKGGLVDAMRSNQCDLEQEFLPDCRLPRLMKAIDTRSITVISDVSNSEGFTF